MSHSVVRKPSGTFKRRFKPKRYQYASVKFGVSRPAAGFFLAPGLGKTIIILMIFKILKTLGLVDELLVIAKRRICYEVWPKEIRKWDRTCHFSYAIVHGRHKEEALWAKCDIRIMNYDSMDWFKRQRKWFRRGKRVMLACDESSKLRHTRTLRFRSLKKVLPHFVRRYIATGSPAPNGLMGIFGQIYVLDFGDRLGQYITHFRNKYFTPSGYMGYKWKLMKGADKKIFERIKPLVIRYGNDELDLPPLTPLFRKVKLPPKAREIYDEMEREFIVRLENDDIVAANAAVASTKLRQMANGGVFYNERSKGYRLIHDAKVENLVDLLEELNGEPALVAYEYKHDIERIKKYLKKHAPQFKDAPFVGGHTKDKELRKLLRKWDKGEIPVMFGNPASIAHGLNLQGKGGIVIFFSLTWNLEDYEQFIQRVWRQGQKRRVLVYHIVAKNTVDDAILLALASKDRTQKALLNAMEHHYGVHTHHRRRAERHSATREKAGRRQARRERRTQKWSRRKEAAA